MPPRGPVLTVIITSSTEGLDKGLDVAAKKIGSLGKTAGKLASVAKVAAPVVGVAAAAAKMGASADKAQTSTKAFNEAMLNAGASSSDLSGTLKDAQASAKGMAFGGQEAKDSLVSLMTATGDAEESARLLAISQDIARLSGADLSVASDAVAKAYAGQDRALKALLPGLEAGATGIDTIANAEALAAGQSEIFANSAEGMGIRTTAAFKGIAMAIGTAVQPAFKALLASLLPLLTAFGELVTALLPVLVPLITAVANIFTVLANIITRLVTAVLPPLKRIIDLITGAFKLARDAISGVVGMIGNLIEKVNALLAPLQKAIDKLHEISPFQGQIGGIIGGNAVTVAGMMVPAARTGISSANAGGVVINIYGDPAVIEARVTRALRDYARRNGAGSIFTPERK